MKILNLSYSDYSNFSHNNCMALLAAGIDCQAITCKPHSFGYSEHARIVQSRPEIITAAKNADLVQVFHSSEHLFNLIRGVAKRVFVYHTGTIYRQDHRRLNEVFSDVERTFIDSPEFYNLGSQNCTYIATAIDTDKIQFCSSGNLVRRFAHYPSLPKEKGTEKIKKIMANFPYPFDCSTELVPHDKNLERISKCDIYIEMLNREQDGKRYGSFGVTAFEAAAMGKAVITNSIFHDVYSLAYGVSWLYVCNDEQTLRSTVDQLATREDFSTLSKKIRQWIVDKHSLEATGNYLKRFL